MDTLILHLPLGAVESFASVQTHHGNQCLMVQKEGLLRILRQFHLLEIDDTLSNIERLIEIFPERNYKIPIIADMAKKISR